MFGPFDTGYQYLVIRPECRLKAGTTILIGRSVDLLPFWMDTRLRRVKIDPSTKWANGQSDSLVLTRLGPRTRYLQLLNQQGFSKFLQNTSKYRWNLPKWVPPRSHWTTRTKQAFFMIFDSGIWLQGKSNAKFHDWSVPVWRPKATKKQRSIELKNLHVFFPIDQYLWIQIH